MLCWTRARQHEQNRCCWRFFHETTRTYRLFCAALVLVVAACGGGGGPVGLSDVVAVVGDQHDHEGRSATR